MNRKHEIARLPSEEECLQILRESGAHDLFINHLRRVQGIARAVCAIAKKRGVKVDEDLVSVAALLHDVSKHNAICNHGKEGADYLRSKGLPEVAEVIETHCPENLGSGKLVPRTTEQKIVFYADMRANPGRIVTLEDRFTYIRECYPQAESAISELYLFAKQIEWELLGDKHDLVALQVKEPKRTKTQNKKIDEIEQEILDHEIEHLLHNKHSKRKVHR